MSLVELMNTMQTSQLFEQGEYIVIYVDMNTYSEKEAHKYIWSKWKFYWYYYINLTCYNCLFFFNSQNRILLISTKIVRNRLTLAVSKNEHNHFSLLCQQHQRKIMKILQIKCENTTQKIHLTFTLPNI